MLTHVTDDSGFVHAELQWQGERLASVVIRAAGESSIAVNTDIEQHPVLGPSHVITTGHHGTTHVSAVNWAAPTMIPAIFSPGILPAQTGTMLLNVIATLARDAGIKQLRYGGPYPTAALYQSLMQCFAASGPADGVEPLAHFTSEDWLNTALLGVAAKTAIASAASQVSFSPDPFVRQWIAPNICTQHRRQLERVMIRGTTFHLEGDSLRLVHKANSAAAQVWFGDVCWATVAEIDTSQRRCGTLLDLYDVPALDLQVTAHTVGKQLPAALLDGLADLIAADVAAPLQSAIAALVRNSTIRWAHTDVRAVRMVGDVIEIHAGLWQCLAPQGMAQVITALVSVLTPVFMMRLQRTLQLEVAATVAAIGNDAQALI